MASRPSEIHDLGRRVAWPTFDADLNAVLAEFTSRVRGHFGPDLVGVYLQGSFAVGDADAYSDVDWLVVTGREVAAAERASLDVLHRDIYALPAVWAQHLEGSYACAAALASPPDGRPWLYLDNGARALVASDHDNTWVVRWCVREKGIALAGPPAVTLLPPVPAEALAAETVHVMGDWAGEMAEHPERIDTVWLQGFLVMSVCRMLETLATGEIRSKLSAVAFARREIDRRWSPLVERAFAQRAELARGPLAPAKNAAARPDPKVVADTVAFVRDMLREVPRFARPTAL